MSFTWVIFIVLIVFSIVRSSNAKKEAERKRWEAEELRRRRQIQESKEEPIVINKNPQRREAARPASKDIISELFGEPLAGIFGEKDQRKTSAAPQVPIYQMGEGSEGTYAAASSEGASYQPSGRPGSLTAATDFEGKGLGKDYGESLPIVGDMEGPAMRPERVKTSPMISAYQIGSKRKGQGGALKGGILDGRLTKNDILRGVVMAEVLGPPRAKKPQIR